MRKLSIDYNFMAFSLKSIIEEIIEFLTIRIRKIASNIDLLSLTMSMMYYLYKYQLGCTN